MSTERGSDARLVKCSRESHAHWTLITRNNDSNMTDEACVCSARRRFAKRLNRLQARNLSYSCLGWNSCPLSCMQLFKIDFPPKTPPKTPETLTDPNEILQAYVDRTRIQRVKILAPWAKGAQNWRGGVKRYMFL